MIRPATRLHGRDAELEQLTQLINQAAVGEPFVAVIEGEAGIGKSTLLDAAIAIAQDRGVDVIRAKAYELERQRPFGGFVDALKLRPDFPEARLKCAKAFLDLGKWEEAKGHLHAILRATPDHLEAHRFLAQVYAGQGQIRELRDERLSQFPFRMA